MFSSTKFSDGIYGQRVSTVVPGCVTPANTVHKLTGGDLAMKLHYLKAIYYFGANEVVQGLTVTLLKVSIVNLLYIYYPAAGRIRIDDAGRPHVKCNDGGVRIVEACCNWTMEEWLEKSEVDRHRRLVPDKVVGPDIQFSPTVFVQFTRFKCGGMTVGFSWSHLLGDMVSASNCINLWGQLLSGKEIPKTFQFSTLQNELEKSAKAEHDTVLPLSIKQVKQVGDFWLTPNSKRMATFSIELATAKLNDLQSKMSTSISTFETLSAIMWQSIAKIRAEKEPKQVTICRNSTIERTEIFSNQVVVNTVIANSSPAKAELLELAKLINKEVLDEMKRIDELVNRVVDKLDIILYGSNLTFVDMESINLYGLELKGQKPVHVEYSIDGVGDEGSVLVLQGSDGNKADTIGRVLTVILPEEEIPQLRKLLENDWGIV